MWYVIQTVNGEEQQVCTWINQRMDRALFRRCFVPLYEDVWRKEGIANYSTHYDIDIVDRVGGGDSFTGAMIYSLITGKDDKNAIEFAVAASCLKHSIEGDFNRIMVSDVENLINNGGNGRVQR